ncbi:hypothetical protein MP228_006996 [Amoeboaphelidium protococcarum]|nr:hypothetical protein MP228_006996 [Amoeboaphelidium protococcarum]
MEKGLNVAIRKKQRWKDRWIVLRGSDGLAVYKTDQEYELMNLYKLDSLSACLHSPLNTSSSSSSASRRKSGDEGELSKKGRPHVIVLLFQHLIAVPSAETVAAGVNGNQSGTVDLGSADHGTLKEQQFKLKTTMMFIDFKVRSAMEDFLLMVAQCRFNAKSLLPVNLLSWHSLSSESGDEVVVPESAKSAGHDKYDEQGTIISLPTMSTAARLGFICTTRPSFDADWWWIAAHDVLIPFENNSGSSLQLNDTSQIAGDNKDIQVLPALNKQKKSGVDLRLPALNESAEEDGDAEDQQSPDEEEYASSPFSEVTQSPATVGSPLKNVSFPPPPTKDPQIYEQNLAQKGLRELVDAPSITGYLYKKKLRGGLQTSRRNTVLTNNIVPGTLQNIGSAGATMKGFQDGQSAAGEQNSANKSQLPKVSNSRLKSDSSYHQRYFVLRGTVLSWYQDAREYEVLRMLDLKDVIWIKLDLRLSGINQQNTSIDAGAMTSESDTGEESEDEYISSTANTKSLVQKLIHSGRSNSPPAQRNKKLAKKQSRAMSISFGLGVSNSSFGQVVSVDPSSSQGSPMTPILSPVNVAIKQVALPTAANPLMEVSVTRTQSAPVTRKSSKVLAKEWCSGVGILNVNTQFPAQGKHGDAMSDGLTQMLYESAIEVSQGRKLISDAAGTNKNLSPGIENDTFLKILANSVKQSQSITKDQLKLAWAAFYGTLGVPVAVNQVLPFQESVTTPLKVTVPVSAVPRLENKSVEEMTQQAIVSLEQYYNEQNHHLNASSKLFHIRIITSKRDYVLATERVDEFVKWVIALRRAWIKARIS